MISWQRDVLDQNLTGTASEIAATLNSFRRTKNPTSVNYFKAKTREWGILFKDENGVAFGPLVDLRKNPETPQELVRALNELFTLLNDKESTVISTDKEKYGYAVYVISMTLISMGVMTLEQLSTYYAEIGGLAYEGVTETDVSEAKASYDLYQEQIQIEQLSREVNNLFDAARNAAVTSAGNGSTKEEAIAAGIAIVEAA